MYLVQGGTRNSGERIPHEDLQRREKSVRRYPKQPNNADYHPR